MRRECRDVAAFHLPANPLYALTRKITAITLTNKSTLGTRSKMYPTSEIVTQQVKENRLVISLRKKYSISIERNNPSYLFFTSVQFAVDSSL
jgi:hypothetical protein